jgi:hypothetical protein
MPTNEEVLRAARIIERAVKLAKRLTGVDIPVKLTYAIRDPRGMRKVPGFYDPVREEVVIAVDVVLDVLKESGEKVAFCYALGTAVHELLHHRDARSSGVIDVRELEERAFRGSIQVYEKCLEEARRSSHG